MADKINILICTAKNTYEYTEYDIGEALKSYINDNLHFDSVVFPITEEFWDEKICTAVDAEVLTVTDKINLLNSICKRNSLKITKVFSRYSVEYIMPKEI